MALVLRSTEGTGKSLFTQLVGRLVGRHNTVVSSSSEQVVGRFNGHLMDKLLIVGEEAFFAGDPRQTGPLKSLITDSPMSYELKGVNIITEPSYHRMILNTNEKWAVPASVDARRFAVFEVSPSQRGDRDYFEKLAGAIYGEEAECFLQQLLDRDISKFRPSQLPRSAALVEQKIRSLTGVARWLYDWLAICDREVTSAICDDVWSTFDEQARTTWPQKVTAGYLYAQYKDFTKNDRFSHGPGGEAQFAKELKQILPSARTKRESSGKRRRYLELPTLRDARRELQNYLNCDDPAVLWDNAEEEGANEATASNPVQVPSTYGKTPSP